MVVHPDGHAETLGGDEISPPGTYTQSAIDNSQWKEVVPTGPNKGTPSSAPKQTTWAQVTPGSIVTNKAGKSFNVLSVAKNGPKAMEITHTVNVSDDPDTDHTKQSWPSPNSPAKVYPAKQVPASQITTDHTVSIDGHLFKPSQTPMTNGHGSLIVPHDDHIHHINPYNKVWTVSSG